DDARRADISEVDVAAGTVTELAHGKGSATHPLYAPDGRYIAFVRGAEQRDEVEGQRIILLTRAGGALRELPPTFDEHPELGGWRPDSKSILYSEFKGMRT